RAGIGFGIGQWVEGRTAGPHVSGLRIAPDEAGRPADAARGALLAAHAAAALAPLPELRHPLPRGPAPPLPPAAVIAARAWGSASAHLPERLLDLRAVVAREVAERAAGGEPRAAVDRHAIPVDVGRRIGDEERGEVGELVG